MCGEEKSRGQWEKDLLERPSDDDDDDEKMADNRPPDRISQSNNPKVYTQ